MTQADNTNQLHTQCFEMLGAYSLDAVTDDERAMIEEHLETCEVCRDELAILNGASGYLSMLADEQEPPASLRNSIASIAATEPQFPRQVQTDTDAATAPTAPPPDAPAGQTPPVSIEDERTRRSDSADDHDHDYDRGSHGGGGIMTMFLPWAAAAVLLIAVLGLGFWNMQLRSELSDRPELDVVSVQSSGSEGAEAELLYWNEQDIIFIDVRGLPERDEEEIYQVWLIEGDTPQPAGTFAQASGQVAVAADLAQYGAIAITIEPGPLGSEAPTTDPILVSEIL